MIITYQGGESFRISQGNLSLELNPANKRFKSDISLYSTGHPSLDEESFVIAGPGEYEVKDVAIQGFKSEGAEGKINTIYLISFEGLNLCFMGALANPALSAGTLEALDDVDILFVPVGGGEALDAAAANKLSVAIEPSIVIPMRYTDSSLKQFLKEAGEESAEKTEKLVVKKKDLEGREGDIIVLKEE